MAWVVSPIRGSPDKIYAAAGLLFSPDGPGPLTDFKDFIRKASGCVWEGRGQRSFRALHRAQTHSIRAVSQ